MMISIVVPRPIAWVSTIGADGSVNLAPYSFANAVAGSPPVVMFSVSGTRTNRKKDTLRNVEETGEFVFNICDEALAQQMNATSGDYEYGVSEFAMARLELAPCVDVKAPRVAAAPASLECKLLKFVPVEGNTMVLGRVLRYHVREGLIRPNGLADALLMKPLARLGGDEYGTIGSVLEIKRPVV
jgi:flavin reductase (DIM6/NTAB) family NADH-FMN oxidoreductase RutF